LLEHETSELVLKAFAACLAMNEADQSSTPWQARSQDGYVIL